MADVNGEKADGRRQTADVKSETEDLNISTISDVIEAFHSLWTTCDVYKFVSVFEMQDDTWKDEKSYAYSEYRKFEANPIKYFMSRDLGVKRMLCKKIKERKAKIDRLKKTNQ